MFRGRYITDKCSLCFYVFATLCKYVCLVQDVNNVKTIWSNSPCPLLLADSLVSLSVMTDQCNIYVSNKSICIMYEFIILSCAQLLSVVSIRVGNYLQLGKYLCYLTFSAQRTVFVFKDIVLFSQNFTKFYNVVLFLWREINEDLKSWSVELSLKLKWLKKTMTCRQLWLDMKKPSIPASLVQTLAWLTVTQCFRG